MRFDERRIGDYRIYVGALEGAQGDGYIAALVVERQRTGSAAGEIVLRDESMACGHRWRSSDEALAYAMQKGRALIQRRTAELAVC